MQRNILLTFLLLLPFLGTPPVEAGLWDSFTGWFAKRSTTTSPAIGILVADDIDRVILEVRGRYALYDPYTKEHISNRFLGKSDTIEAIRSGLKWGEEFPGIYQLQIVPLDPTTVILLDETEYQGNLYIYDAGGTISIVNEIDLEEYLHCTLSTAVDDTVSREALSALVIAARTNAYYQVMHPRNTYWTVEADQVGFRGCDVPRISRVDEAIRNTRYMVLSLTGPYDGATTPFLSSWGPISTLRPSGAITQGKITIEQAQDMAERGAHAAQILSKAFPGSSVMLTKSES